MLPMKYFEYQIIYNCTKCTPYSGDRHGTGRYNAVLPNCGDSILNMEFSQSHACENIPCCRLLFLQYVHDKQYPGWPNVNPWAHFVFHGAVLLIINA